VVEVLAQELPFEVESAPEPEPAPVVEVEKKEKEVPVEPTAVDRLMGWLARMMKEVAE
jgi:cell division protein FtsZ